MCFDDGIVDQKGSMNGFDAMDITSERPFKPPDPKPRMVLWSME